MMQVKSEVVRDKSVDARAREDVGQGRYNHNPVRNRHGRGGLHSVSRERASRTTRLGDWEDGMLVARCTIRVVGLVHLL